MLYLLIGIIGSSSLVIILKMFDLKGVNMHVGITMNYIVGAALSFLFSPKAVSADYIVHAPWFWIALVVGMMFSFSFVVYGLSAQRSGVAVTTISGRAAVVIPVVFAFTVLDAQATVVKVAMLALILVAMCLILKKDKAPDRKTGAGMWVLLLPLSVFLFNGANDTMVQYAQGRLVTDTSDYTIFNGTMFAAGAVTAALTFLVSSFRHPHTPNGKDVAWGALLGFMNWVCMTGVLYGLDYLDGSIFYPLYYTGAIVISTIVGVVAFKEKLTKLNYAGIVIAVIAIAVLSTQ